MSGLSHTPGKSPIAPLKSPLKSNALLILKGFFVSRAFPFSPAPSQKLPFYRFQILAALRLFDIYTKTLNQTGGAADRLLSITG